MYLLDGGIINPKTYPSHPLAKAYAGKAESVLVNDVLDIVEDPDGRRDKERSR
jgi:hypothetical protein